MLVLTRGEIWKIDQVKKQKKVEESVIDFVLTFSN